MCKYNNKVNWIISYWRDLDFLFVYGVYKVKKKRDVEENVKNSSNFKCGIVWFVFYCSIIFKWEKYVCFL